MNSPVTPDPIERELKLGVRDLSADRLHQILQTLGADLLVRSPLAQLGNTYFDTTDGALHAMGVAIRLRAVDATIEMTVKVREPDESGLSRRQEWNIPVSTPQLDWTALQALPLPPAVVSLITPERLHPVFQNVLMRTDWQFVRSDLSVVISHDLGTVTVGAAQSPVSEVELEWRSGSIHGLLALGMELADCIPAYMAVISKAERGERLIRGESPVLDPRPTSRLGWINRLGRMLDPLAGPDSLQAAAALEALRDPVALGFLAAVERGDIPVGLGRWMLESQQEGH